MKLLRHIMLKTTGVVLLAVSGIVLATPALSQPLAPLDKFVQVAGKAGLKFRLPSGFEAVEPDANAGMHYDLAIRCVGQPLELRYIIQPLRMEEYTKSKRPGSKTVMSDPNQLFGPTLLVLAAHISGRNPAEIPTEAFGAAEVQKDFNASAGFTTAVKLDSKFGSGYRLASVNILHKQDVSDAVVFCLCNDMKTMNGQFFSRGDVFKALRFK